MGIKNFDIIVFTIVLELVLSSISPLYKMKLVSRYQMLIFLNGLGKKIEGK